MTFSQQHFGIVLALLVSALLIGGAYFLSPLSEPFVESATATATDDLTRLLAEKDTDGDGLKDWEEELWGTDPLRVDTDGDGKTDLESVRTRVQTAEETDTDLAEELSKTQEFSRSFFKEYLLLRGEFGEVSGGLADAVVARTLFSLRPETRERFDTSTMQVVESSNAAYTAYINAVALALVPEDPSIIQKNELVLLQEAIDTRDVATAEKIAVIAQGYEKLAKDLAQIAVPRAVKFEHEILIQTAHTLNLTVTELSLVLSDPVVTIQAVSRHQDDALAFIKAAYNLRKVLEEEGVALSETSLGSMLPKEIPSP